ncbi:MAG: nucleotidyltransferase domain-containing protein [Patescibacteria group bacterium]
MDTNLTIPEKAALDALCKKHHLLLMLLHGSQVDGPRHSKSDIDVGVTREPHKPAFRCVDLVSDLMEIFHSDRIDLVDLTHADPLLLFAVMRRAHLLAGDTRIFDHLEQKAFHRYNDYQRYFTEERQFVKNRLASYVTH